MVGVGGPLGIEVRLEGVGFAGTAVLASLRQNGPYSYRRAVLCGFLWVEENVGLNGLIGLALDLANVGLLFP